MCSSCQIWPISEFITFVCMPGRLMAHHISFHGVNVTSVDHNDEHDGVQASSSWSVHFHVHRQVLHFHMEKREQIYCFQE